MSEQCFKDPVRSTLKKLIFEANETFDVDEVLREFRITKEKRSNRKLLKILTSIAKTQPDVQEHLLEAARLLEKKDPFYCLLIFLNHYSDTNLLQLSSKRKDSINCTPQTTLSSFGSGKKMNETSTIAVDPLSEIKERIVQAAKGSTRPSVLDSAILMPSSFQVSDKPHSTVVAEQTAIWDFKGVENYQCTQSNIIALPVNSQEPLLLYDLIYCLTGMRGSYIVPEECISSSSGIKFKISDQVHGSLRDIAQEILPLAAHYICIQKFIQNASSNNCGQVLQALGAALKNLVHDYYVMNLNMS